MERKKTVVILPQLKDRGGDLTKQWFVEYSCRNPRTNEMKRFRIYEGFAVLTSKKERYALAEKIINEIKEKFEKGNVPFLEKVNNTSYKDELLYHHIAKRWGEERVAPIGMRAYLSGFLSVKKVEVIPHTLRTYKSKLRIFCEWAEKTGLDKIHVSDIEQSSICDFIRHIVTEHKIGQSTVKKYGQILHGFFDYLLKVEKIIEKNPVHDIPKMGLIKDEAPRPIPDNVRKILAAYMKKHDPQLWLLCKMEYYCAIRPNECRQLRICDIDFENRVITVPKNVSKNRMSEPVDVPVQLHNYMKKKFHLDEMPEEYFVFSHGGIPGPTMLGQNNLRFRFDKIRNKLGLPTYYKLYSFKHTGGIKLVNSGVSTWELQKHFRHKSIDTTEQYIRRNTSIRSHKIRNDFPDI